MTGIMRRMRRLPPAGMVIDRSSLTISGCRFHTRSKEEYLGVHVEKPPAVRLETHEIVDVNGGGEAVEGQDMREIPSQPEGIER